MWKFALVLAVVHGAFCIAPSTYWVLETLKCNKHRLSAEPNTNLLETPEAMDQMCKQQDEYYRCLEKLVGLMEPASVSDLPSRIAIERPVINSLCNRDSPWRRRYLESAPCINMQINMQQTDICHTPKFLEAVGLDMSFPLEHVEEIIENCIAATLSIKCGVEAGQLYKHLSKLKGDGACQSAEMTDTDSDTCSNGIHATGVSGEIYDQLVKRIGYIPEQHSEESFVLHKHEESESDENISSSLEIEESEPYSHFTEFEDYNENLEHDVSEDNGNPDIFAVLANFSLQWQDVMDQRQHLIAQGRSHTVSPIFERARSARAVNTKNYETVRLFSDGRVNYYSRIGYLQRLESVKCFHIPDYFVCINMYRTVLPRCLNTTVFTGRRKGKFFTVEIDPEFGAQWYKTAPKEAYLFEPWVHQSNESDQLPYTSASVTEDAQVSYVSDNRGSEDGVELLEDVDADTIRVSKDALPFSVMEDSDAYELTTKKNKKRTMEFFFNFGTQGLPLTSKILKDFIPKNVAEALSNLYESKGKSFENVRIRLGRSGSLYIFWNNQQESVIDTITCGKVNECHPKGKNVWKCVIVPSY